MNENSDAELVDLATGNPVVVDPATGIAKFKNRRGRPPRNPPPIVPVTAAERAARLAARAADAGGAPSPEAGAPAPAAEETISLVSPPEPQAAPETTAEPVPQAPADPDASLAAAAGVDADALLRARRAAALRMKQGLDDLASSVNAMNAFFAASPQKQAAKPQGGAQPSQRERDAERERQRRLQSERDRERNRQMQLLRQQQSERDRERNRQQQLQRQQQQAQVQPQQQQRGGGAARPAEPPAEQRPVLPPIKISDLQELPAGDLFRLAAEQNLAAEGGSGRHETVFALLQEHVRRGGTVEAEGWLDVWQEGYGFLRSALADFKSVAEDVFVPQSLVQRLGLRPGDRIACRTRPADRGQRDRHFVATDVVSVNGLAPDKARLVPPFASLPAAAPDRPLRLAGAAPDPVAEAFDRAAPLFFGSRALALLPRGADHAAFARSLAVLAADAQPRADVWLALFGAMPEARAAAAALPVFRERRATLLCVDWEDTPDKALQVASVLTEAVRRSAENGADAIVVVDTLPALVRAYGMVATNQQGALTDGVDGRALQKARRLFATGRAFADRPGSATVVALAERPAPDAPFAVRLAGEFRPAATAVLELEGDPADPAAPLRPAAR
ncbi:MAG: hypothetical protein IJV65_01225 [Kiritimatiellae bacterium]|nr:hypothetical protein [Kiritimatiellia bacterium]